MTAEPDLSGQIAIVTGGGRNLGREMALALAAVGAQVAVAARNEQEIAETVELIHQRGGRGIAVKVDVTDAASVEAMVREVEQTMGAVTLLVNNAGVLDGLGPIWEIEPEAWRRAFDVNLHGAFLCTRRVLPSMMERRAGRIINVASGAALSPLPYGASYCVSKAALARFTECVAGDVSDYGIKVFAIDPGTVRMGMTIYLMESEVGQKWAPWFREFVLAGGDVPPDLCQRLVTALASGRCDSLSGRFIQVRDDVEEMTQNSEQIAEEDLYTLRLRKLT